MADFLQKYTLVVSKPVTIEADASIIAFDFTNDSPFDVDIQWGSNKPIALTIPPTTIWRGAQPSSDLLISGNKRNGQVIATPSYPGGGSPPTGAPAMQLTVHGYQKGNEPAESIATLNRLQNVGNPVPIGTAATNIVNDGNPAGTQIVEATTNDGVQHVLMFNDGNLALQKNATSADQEMLDLVDLAVGGHIWAVFLATGATHGLYFTANGAIPLELLASGGIQTDNGIISTDGLGKITSTKALGGANQAYFVIAPGDGGTWSISELTADHGLAFVMGTVQLEVHPTKGIKPRNQGAFISGFSEFSGTVTGTYNHNMTNGTPDAVIPMQSVIGSQTMGFDTLGATTVHVTSAAGNAFTALAYQLNA